jgi:hypothetical protein
MTSSDQAASTARVTAASSGFGRAKARIRFITGYAAKESERAGRESGSCPCPLEHRLLR